MKYSILFISIISLSLGSCKAKEEKQSEKPLAKKTNSGKTAATISKKAPIINIIDTLEIKRTILCVKDSALTVESMNEKLEVIFTKKLPDAAMQGKLKIMGEPIVWYKSKKTPYFFHAGLPVDKAPSKITKGMFMSTTGKDSALVAHFFGPNELTNIGYDALTEMLKENNRNSSAAAYEIYKNNKFLELNKKKDQYKLQTDIVMPYKRR